jgi:hypothetical protein
VLRVVVLGDRVERVLEHRVVVADRAHVLAAAAAGDDAGAAQDAFPKIEAVFRTQHRLLLRGIGLVEHLAEELRELRESVRRAVFVACRPVAVPVLDHVAGAGGEATPAFGALAERLRHASPGRDRHRGKHGGEHHARPEFRRQQHAIEAERAEPSLDRGVVEREQWLHRLVRIALVAPGIDMRRRHDQRRVALQLEPQHHRERDLLERGQGQLVVVVFVPLVPARDARDARREPLADDDDAAGVVIRDIRRHARIGRIGRVRVDLGAVGDAHDVGAERSRLRLDLVGGDGLLEDGDHETDTFSDYKFACRPGRGAAWRSLRHGATQTRDLNDAMTAVSTARCVGAESRSRVSSASLRAKRRFVLRSTRDDST